MPRVLVTPPQYIPGEWAYRAVLNQAGFEIVYPEAGSVLSDSSQLLKQLEGIDAVLASVEPYSRPVLEQAGLRVVARSGVGFDAVDVDAATEMGTVVTTTPGTNEHSVAETASALITGVYRGLPLRDQKVRTGQWKNRVSYPRLSGKTLGLLGLGRIGKAMVPRAQGLGLTVIAFDPYADQAFAAAHHVKICGLDELLAAADIVSLHLPATAETENLINRETLAKMKAGSVLINTARGALVDEDALCEALSSRHLLGAGLDVFKQEPLPLESPLLELDNLLTSPHTGGMDDDSLEAMSTLAAQCIVDLYQGRWPEPCVVNKSLAPGWKW